ncbi:hypothetical protein Q667_15600 [Marinobacter sp. C1S70]|uniref:GspH/FimT family protein n=1 Tax=Marinobacter sp. C1S70 TaxID=1396859 RepID=UPI0003B82E6E|nr:GspH/FimT family protein [Marinobacter sp. C1S70]ERS87102.1 hypothetical protein Q667_15600 [Marinobacter sp. C1S70]
MRSRYYACQGLTLIELLTLLAILSILLSAAIPGTNKLVENGQGSAEVNSILGFFALARQEAVMSGKVVTMCPLKRDGRCGRDWNSDVSMFHDPQNQRSISANTIILRVLPSTSYGTRKVRSLSRSYFQFRPNGMMYSDLGNITWCPPSNSATSAAHIIISKGGRVRVAKDQNGDGIVERANGTAVDC